MKFFKSVLFYTILLLLVNAELFAQEISVEPVSTAGTNGGSSSANQKKRYIEPILLVEHQYIDRGNYVSQSFALGMTLLPINYKGTLFGLNAKFLYSRRNDIDETAISIQPYIRFINKMSDKIEYHSDLSFGKVFYHQNPNNIEQHYNANYDFRLAFMVTDTFLLSTSLFRADINHQRGRENFYDIVSKTNAYIGTVINSPTLNLVFLF